MELGAARRGPVCATCGQADAFVESRAQAGLLVCSNCGTAYQPPPQPQHPDAPGALFGARDEDEADVENEGVSTRGLRVRAAGLRASQDQRRREAERAEERSVPGLAWRLKRDYWRPRSAGEGVDRRVHEEGLRSRHARGVDGDGHVDFSTQAAAYGAALSKGAHATAAVASGGAGVARTEKRT